MLSGPRAKWVQREVAKCTTPNSIGRRIRRAEEAIRVLEGLGYGRDTLQALEAHRELIRILTSKGG